MRRVQSQVTVRALVELNVDQIAQEWNEGEAYDFIVALDAAMADWSFTLKLYEYFAAQKLVNDREEAEDAAALAERSKK